MKVFRKKREKDSSPSSFTRLGRLLPMLLAIGIGALLLFGSSPGVLAQENSASQARVQGAEEGENRGKESPAKIWQGYRELAQKGSWEKSRAELERLYQAKLNQGIRNHYYFAVALLRESEQLPREAVAEMGPILLDYAEKMAPDFSAVFYGRAQWIWAHQPFSISHLSRAAGYWLRGGFYSLANLEESLPQYATLGYMLIFGFLTAVGIYALFLTFRYYAFFHHHLGHLLNLGLPSGVQAVMGGLLLLLPLALGIGWLGMFLAWLLIFWMYESRGERAVSLVLLILVLFLPSAVRLSSSFVSSLDENGVPEIIRANQGVWNSDFHRQLLREQQRREEDPDFLQAVSLLEKRMGKYAEAEQHLRQWIEREGDSPAAYNNLGNVYLATQRVDQAIEAYRKAVRLDGTRTEPYYNLGQAYLQNLLLNEAEAEFRRAKELRPELISFHTSIASRHPNRMTIDRIVERIDLWKRILGESPGRAKLTRDFWAFLGVRYPLPFEEIFGVVFLLILGGIHKGGRGRPLIRRCERCGHIICSRCSRSLVIGNQCLQCVNAFSKSPTGEPQRVREKQKEAAQHQRRQVSLSRWLSFLVPGAGHLHRGHAKEGFAYIFIGALFLTTILLGEGWLPNPLDLEVASTAPRMTGIFFLLFAFYAWVQFRIVQILKKEVKFYFRPAE